MTPSLYKRPRSLVFLDDDADYLELLAQTLPSHWPARFLTSSQQCLGLLRAQLTHYKTDVWLQQSMVNRWHRGEPLLPQLLGYWASDNTRYGLGGVLVIDYAMPLMTGLDVLRELQGWPGARILLTGRADTDLAIQAFNEGLIDQFIEKQAPDFTRQLVRAVEGLQGRAVQRVAGIWQSTLNAAQQAALCHPRMTERLARAARRAGWVEHVVIGDPFGMLGMDAAGRVGWLQLRHGDPVAGSVGVLTDQPLQTTLGVRLPQREARALRLGRQAPLHCAAFGLAPLGVAPMAGRDAYLARLPARRVE